MARRQREWQTTSDQGLDERIGDDEEAAFMWIEDGYPPDHHVQRRDLP
ncbi:MAG: hypothetical protein WCF81_16350 [Roseiarcus sp.]